MCVFLCICGSQVITADSCHGILDRSVPLQQTANTHFHTDTKSVLRQHGVIISPADAQICVILFSDSDKPGQIVSCVAFGVACTEMRCTCHGAKQKELSRQRRDNDFKAHCEGVQEAGSVMQKEQTCVQQQRQGRFKLASRDLNTGAVWYTAMTQVK